MNKLLSIRHEQVEMLDAIRYMFNEALKSVDANKNTARTDGVVKMSLSSIPSNAEIQNNMIAVAKMKSVKDLTGSEFLKGDQNLIEQVEAYFNSLGNVVTTNYGDVELRKKGIKSSIGHGIGRNKSIAFKAVPEVLKNGKIIDYQSNWKNRGYDTAVFAAPIKIADEEYYLAVVVVVEKTKNSYYLHEVALQEKGDNAMFKTGTVNNGTSGKALSPTQTILQKLQSVNTQSMQKTENDTTKMSLQALNSEYMSAVENGDTETAQKYVDEAAARAGYTIRAYHGTSRGDRVGNVFLPERATSGPMAFFTSSKDIADNYARDKADTSIAYDEMYDDYFTQFRVIHNGENISVSDYWSKLPFSKKLEIKEKAKHVTFDDDAENIVYDNSVQYGSGGFDAYRINSNNGNILAALTEEWLIDGQLYGEEHKFLDVLKLVGINDVKYYNPNERHEKVYDTYLKIENPFRTEDADASFAELLLEWYENQPEDKYEVESEDADMWDKNNRTAEEWVEDKLMEDIRNGTSHAWTSIPDAVTDYLKSLGHDGIFDIGGKNGGESHTVYVPFSSEQIKSAETVTYDDNGEVIPLDKRFDKKKVDIRFSLKEVDRNTEKEYNSGSRIRKQTSYNESETLFMQWKDSKSVSVGDTKAFVRFDKKIHFYEKTNDGCIEITKKDYDAKRVLEHEQDYESVERRIDVLSHKYGTVTKRGDSKSNDVYRNSGDDEGNDNSSERERFQNEQSGNLERSGSDSKTPFKVKPSLQETSDAAKAREELLKANDNLRVANTVLKNII